VTLLSDLDDPGIRSDERDPGAYLNTGDRYVLVHEPDVNDLRRLLARFEARLRDELLRLFLTPFETVRQRYGKLDLRDQEGRPGDLQFGLTHYGADPAKPVLIRRGALVHALVALRLNPPGTSIGQKKARQRIKGIGSVVTFAASFEEATRDAILQTAFDQHDNLDDVVLLSGQDTLGVEALKRELHEEHDAIGFLDRLARTCQEGISASTKDSSVAPIRGRSYASRWFARSLATEGVWLLPVADVSGVRKSYPTLLLPVGVRMAVPEARAELAEDILSASNAGRGTAKEGLVATALAIAGASNLWSRDWDATYPLVAFKDWAQNQPRERVRSHHSNALFRMTCAHRGVEEMEHWTAPALTTSKRIAKRGVLPFNWAEHPTERNTRKAAEILGHEVETASPLVSAWARDLRSLLPLFERRNIDRLASELTPWLIFLLTIVPSEAPATFKEIGRSRHVNSYGATSDFVEFLRANYQSSNASIASVAISTMKNAWRLAAVRDGFGDELTNPFDVDQDRVVASRTRGNRTHRSALDQNVLNVLVQSNRADDYGFARDLKAQRGSPLWWRTVKDANTGAFERVFFPLPAIALDIILSCGFRNGQTTWLDSGEGDELLVDPVTGAETPSDLGTRTRGRRQGFLRSFELFDGGSRRRTVGMYVNTDKASKSYEVPWCDPHIASAVTRLRQLQVRYNPISRAVPAMRADTDNMYVGVAVPDAWPLFRDPVNSLAQPLSEERVRSYWKLFLIHVQSKVDKEMGYHYPLLDENGSPIYDVHSLRVTTVTVLIENGVDPDIVRLLVGHQSILMTWWYNAVRNEKIHRAIQEGVEARRSPQGELARDDVGALADRTAAEAVTIRAVEDYAAVDLLHDHRHRRTELHVFAHGICPGGDCATGGERRAEGRYDPVWRPRACSRCRYRLTGPAFLAGLVWRLNALMAEIKIGVDRETRLNDEIDDAERAGQCIDALRATVSRERADRDHLWSEWCAELKTVKAAERAFAAGDGKALVPLGGTGQANLAQAEAHDFELLQRLVGETEFLRGASADLPAGVEERRDGWLRKVMRAEKLDDVVYSLPPAAFRKAMNALGDLLLTHAHTGEQLQRLLDGETKISDDPAIGDLRTIVLERAQIGRITHE
jgi:hypothetical protein